MSLLEDFFRSLSRLYNNSETCHFGKSVELFVVNPRRLPFTRDTTHVSEMAALMILYNTEAQSLEFRFCSPTSVIVWTDTYKYNGCPNGVELSQTDRILDETTAVSRWIADQLLWRMQGVSVEERQV